MLFPGVYSLIANRLDDQGVYMSRDQGLVVQEETWRADLSRDDLGGVAVEVLVVGALF